MQAANHPSSCTDPGVESCPGFNNVRSQNGPEYLSQLPALFLLPSSHSPITPDHIKSQLPYCNSINHQRVILEQSIKKLRSSNNQIQYQYQIPIHHPISLLLFSLHPISYSLPITSCHQRLDIYIIKADSKGSRDYQKWILLQTEWYFASRHVSHMRQC
jgi:hypothetical protein